jgi:hypothetical protein
MGVSDSRALAFLVLGAAALAIPASAGAATTSFTNPTPIDIPNSGGTNNGSPYPSSIAVAGLAPSVNDVTVTLNGFAHQDPIEVGAALTAPSGQSMLLMFCIGGTSAITNVTFSLSDAGSALPTNVTPLSSGGTYRPTSHDCGPTIPSFPPPGPGTAYANPGPYLGGTATLNGTFAGSNPNGTWNLFVRDFNAGSSGNIAGGWSLSLATPDLDTTSPNTTITKGPKAKTKKKRATFEFSSTEPGSSFECALDGKTSFKPCSSPFSVKVKKGKHTFAVQATDQSGNTDATPASDKWKVKKKKAK